MKPYVINKNSWHYKMISKDQHWDGFMSHQAPKDFCSYWRMVVGKLLMYAFFIAVGTFFVVFLGYNIYLDPIPVLAGLFTAIFIVLSAFSLVISWEKLKERKRKHDYDVEFEDKQESLLKMKYRAFKEKTCPMVEYK